jgi:hypothetical protein
MQENAMSIQGHLDALPLIFERAGESRRRQAVARSIQCRRDVSEFDKPDIGRDGCPPGNREGTVIGAGAWLTFVIAATVSFGS